MDDDDDDDDDDKLFCSMVDRRKAFKFIYFQPGPLSEIPSRTSDTPRAGFEPTQNLSSGLVQ